jgi:hypothetical protein
MRSIRPMWKKRPRRTLRASFQRHPSETQLMSQMLTATPETVTLRRAVADDAVAIEHIAALDSSRPPAGEVLVAEVDGEVWAAVSLEDGHAVADPFRPSGEPTLLLLEHARRLRRGRGERRRPFGRRRLRPAIA